MMEETRTAFRKPALLPGSRALIKTPAPVEKGPATSGAPIALKRLVWLYFWLLIFEGALRKWVFPQYSAQLLIIRDPVVLWIYFLAFQANLIPRDKLLAFLWFLCGTGLMLVAIQLVMIKVPLSVLLYGYRTAFLHLPLIFLIPAILDYDDLIRMGKVFLLLAVPMAILMGYQFRSPADAWINKTVGLGGGLQLAAAAGKIRPPGTFSFISGPVAFFSIVTAFVGYGLVSPTKPFPRILLISAAIALGLAVAVSGSRATMLSGLIVIGAWVLGVAASKKVSSAVSNAVAIILIATLVLGRVETFQEGTEILETRFEMGMESEADKGGIAGRFLGELTAPLRWALDVPLLGNGLGVGTNVGAALITGQMSFLLAEGEWGRNLLEAGPIFGLLYIWFRLRLAFFLGMASFKLAKRGHLLAILLFSACGINIITGQLAQPTTLGFTVFTAALCATAIKAYDQRHTSGAT